MGVDRSAQCLRCLPVLVEGLPQNGSLKNAAVACGHGSSILQRGLSAMSKSSKKYKTTDKTTDKDSAGPGCWGRVFAQVDPEVAAGNWRKRRLAQRCRICSNRTTETTAVPWTLQRWPTYSSHLDLGWMTIRSKECWKR